MSQVEVKFPAAPDGGLDSDSVDAFVGPNSWVNMQNFRTGSTDAGVTNVAESIGSTKLLSSPQPSVIFITIGTAEDIPNNRLIFFKYCTTGPWHKISCWDITAQVEYDVLLSSQVVGGLNFNKSFLIHSAEIIGDRVYWTDYLNELRRLNIDAGIKLNQPSYVTDVDPYTSPVNPEVITIIRRPPFYAVTIEKSVDADYENNFIKNEATQFAVEYWYRDYEYSVIGEWSVLAPFNSPDDEFNYVAITMPQTEIIDQDVIQANLIVRYGNTGKSFIIHEWKAADIAAHNTGTPLSFDFYNDLTGIAVDDATANKPFDSVPLKSKTLSAAKNRIFAGNNVEGYDTPATTSMSIAVATVSEDGSYDASWGLLTITYYSGGVAVTSTGGYVVYVEDLGVYYLFDPPSSLPLPTTVSYGDVDAEGPLETMANWFVTNYPPAEDWDSFEYSFSITDGTGLPVSLTVTDVDLPVTAGQRSFKSEGSYGGGMVFFDKYRRKCGVVTNKTLRIEMPIRTYDVTFFNVGMTWALSNTNALAEIPDWAYYYAPLRTENLQTRLFEQIRAVQMFYVTKDDEGVLDFTQTSWDADRYAIGVDVSSLYNIGLGYSFTEGDIMKLFFESNPPADTSVSIIEQSGKWVLVQAVDLGTLGAAVKPLIEIYTPYKASVSEPYWEVGQVYPILNPTTISRAYSSIAGLFNGDVYILERGNSGDEYFTETMSPNDKLWSLWYTDRGWPNITDSIGQVSKTSSISWSNVSIQGTKTNGLSSWEALNEKATPSECGPIQKLQLTSKVAAQGDVMLCICTSETLSLYLSEVQVVDSAGVNAYFASSVDVIGTINVLKGSSGTLNPESVVYFRGNVYWYDRINGKITQYSTNGLFFISDYKMVRFWKLFSDTYNSMTEAEIEALGSRPFVFGGVDPRHDEVLFTIPKLLETPPKGYLIDYPDMIYPWDIWDGQSKTIVYSINSEPDHWLGSYSFTPEYIANINNKLYLFKYGHLWEANQTDSYNNFFGVQYKSRIMPISNMIPNGIKTYTGIQLQVNLTPTLTYFCSEVPYQQVSDLMDYDYRDYEGFIYALILRNKIQPTATGYNLDGLLTAERIRSYAVRLLLEFSATTIPAQLRIINVKFDISKGG